MRKISILSLILFFATFNGQTKSLRELLLESDIVAITEKISDPFYPKATFVAFSDSKKMTVVDSVKVISYLKKGKKDLHGQKLLVNTDLRNAFFNVIPTIKVPEIISPYDRNPPKKKTILFAKTQKEYSEVLYFVELNEDNVTEIENFMVVMNDVQKQKNEAEKCKLYINKYFEFLWKNKIKSDFSYFENILLPNSSFMLFYKEKAPQSTIITKKQQVELKTYLFDGDYFSDTENTNLVYQYFPEETLDFYKTKLSEVRTYDDEFEENPDKYSYHLKFVLEKTNKWNRDTELMLNVLEDYYSSNISLKRDMFERLIEKINEN